MLFLGVSKEKVELIVYQAIYIDCIHESGAATISIHFSRLGAEIAVKRHRQETIDQFCEDGYSLKKALQLLEIKWWDIYEDEIQP